MSDEGASSSSVSSKEDRKKRLMELRLKRNEARKLNHHEVAEEEKRNNLPNSHEWRRRRAEWEESEEKRKAELGDGYERVKNLEMGADIAEKLDNKKRSKHNPDPGVVDFDNLAARKYQRESKQFKRDATKYEAQKEELGVERFYANANTIGLHERKDSEEAIDRLVGDLDKQGQRRLAFHRRRAYDPDADVDFINERNRKFNKKVDKYYGKYTAEIKQNLERGTAL